MAEFQSGGWVSSLKLKAFEPQRNLCLLVAGVFIISSVPPLGSTIVFSYTSAGTIYEISLRSILWIVSLIVGWSRRLLDRALVGSSRKRGSA